MDDVQTFVMFAVILITQWPEICLSSGTPVTFTCGWGHSKRLSKLNVVEYLTWTTRQPALRVLWLEWKRVHNYWGHYVAHCISPG
jgi:hypothetical protein